MTQEEMKQFEVMKLSAVKWLKEKGRKAYHQSHGPEVVKVINIGKSR